MDIFMAQRLVRAYWSWRKDHYHRHTWINPMRGLTTDGRLTVNGPAMWCFDTCGFHYNIEDRGGCWAIKYQYYPDWVEINKGSL